MLIVLAILSGAGLGYLIERGDFCFHSTLRGLVGQPRKLDLLRAYLLVLLVATPLVGALRALGWIQAWVPPFALPANLLGGVIFGIGMVAAATCVTGLFYKLGHGMLGTLVGLAFWALGDVLVYLGPLSGLRESLNASPITVDGRSATIPNFLGPYGIMLLIVLAVLAIWYLWRSPRRDRGVLWGWPILGLSIGLFISLAWLLADAAGSDYPFGTSYVPSGLLVALTRGGADGSLWIPIALVSLIPGAFLAAWRSGTLWVRGEHMGRYLQLAAGGLLMGMGAAISGGCNLGHSLVGVPLLSMGSISTTLSMLLGVFIADRAVRMWKSTRMAPVSAPAEKSAHVL